MTPYRLTPFRRLAAVAAAAVAFVHFSAPGAAQRRSAVPARADAATIAHVLNRIGFGPAPGDVARVQSMGLQAYIEQQLHPERIQDPELAGRLSAFSTLSMSTAELAEQFYLPALEMRREQQQREAQAARQQQSGTGSTAGSEMTMTPPPAPQPTPEQRQIQARQASVTNELMQARMLRAVMSDAQLEEVLVDFWFNHFNVFVGKGQVRQYLTSYERDAIRPHVLGSFRDMLGATAHHPAMLFYLDNFQSQAPPGSETLAQTETRNRLGRQGLTPPRPGQTRPGQVRPGQVRPGQTRPGQIGQGQPPVRPGQPNAQPARPPRGLNENYARELMELHTLGVDGGYTQQDVIEVARILTGWTIDRPQAGGDFIFRPAMHDAGEKTVLGVKFPSGKGEEEGERLLDMLAAHPKTAHHIAFKLAQRFVADEPPAALVDRAAKAFLDTKGDLREVTRTIITSTEFFAEDYRGVKVKTPFEFVVSAARATGATVVNPQPMVQALRDLGMPLYGAQPPTGYSMTADAWVNTGALLARMNFAVQLVNGGVAMRGDAPATRPDGTPRPNAPNRPAQAGRANRAALGAAQNRPGARARQPIQVDVAGLAPDTSEATRDALVASILGGEASTATRETMAKAATPEQLIALTLGSPEFQKR
jgi:uncharacterized protein (DUF1800 family)